MAKILNDLESGPAGPELSVSDYHMVAHAMQACILEVQTQLALAEGDLDTGLERASEKLALLEATTEEWSLEDFIRVLNVVEARAGLEGRTHIPDEAVPDEQSG